MCASFDGKIFLAERKKVHPGNLTRIAMAAMILPVQFDREDPSRGKFWPFNCPSLCKDCVSYLRAPKETHREKNPSLSAFAILLMFAGNAFADTITYTESATATGTLGANSFTDALITLSFTGNTANVSEGPLFVLINNPGPDAVTLTVAGLGTSTFTDDISVFVNRLGVFKIGGAGFEDDTISADILDTENTAFQSYFLATAIGPVSGTSLINEGSDFSTTDGTFNIDSNDEDSTFTATLGTPPVPEPSSILLLGTGLLGAGALRRKLIA